MFNLKLLHTKKLLKNNIRNLQEKNADPYVRNTIFQCGLQRVKVSV